MLNKFHRTFLLVTVVATLSTGCRYSKEYQKVTEAGNKYTTAVDELLVKAGDLQIDSSSEKILLDDRLSNQSLKDYQELNTKDKEIVQTIADIREHNHLLRRYFSKLKELANSDTPEKVKVEIEEVTRNMQKISSDLQKSTILSRPSVVGNIGKLIVNSKIEGVLKEELEKRHPVILQELTIQQEMLKSLGEFMQHRVAITTEAREQRLLIRPLIAAQPMDDGIVSQWIQERKQIFLTDQRVTELKKASQALEEFKDIYTASVEGKINSERLNASLQDIDSFLALLEHSQKSN
ncbi:hypothetical protein [Calothrix sp. 336/3]|uniref:hypothetical protein n=1 Tax=Calothrix sp. 336/3 TaxID=1337936 RepID=UPI0004E29FFD|nr:hypothetical protein [Calothrix sp. 336/3]AKG20080.1 hypothetical protein IJ00_01045 [Calothrix sp. 336/3]